MKILDSFNLKKNVLAGTEETLTTRFNIGQNVLSLLLNELSKI